MYLVPEGGLEPEELARRSDKPVIRAVLWDRVILRAETAPLYALAAVSYEMELRKERIKMVEKLNKYIDHTLLRQDATEEGNQSPL